jgi:multicomponent Na+:H+ antiporter subunit F
MFMAAMIGILATMVLAVLRTLLGPTVFDRILAINMLGTKIILLVAVLGFLLGRPDFLDLALIYVFLNFIGIIAVLKYVKFKNLATFNPDNEEVGHERV